jgi:predicted transposase/invertase (TIGR01784 family)
MSDRKEHDKFFQKALANPLIAREFFEEHLPPHIKALFSPATLKLENDSFIEPSLKESITDVLYSAKINNRDGYIYILCEHQSSSDPRMALRLFKYMLNIAERHLNTHPDCKKFPFIYPCVFYNGNKKYTSSLNLWDLFEDSELVKDTWSNDCKLIDLCNISDEQLKERPWLAVLQILMKYIHEPNLLPRWQQIANILPEFADFNSGVDYVKSAVSYTLTKIKEDDKIKLEEILKSHLNPELGAKIMGSLAHHWKQEGIAEGIAEGIHITEMKLEAKLKEEKITLAKKMLVKKKPLQEIIEFTGLTEKEIEKLK